MAKSIEFLNFISLRGPSIWTYAPVLEAWVDIGELEDYPSNTIPGLYERLSTWLPGLIEHRCSYEERGGFLRRLAEGTWPGHIMEHVTLELLTLIGMSNGFGRARETPIRGVYKVVVTAWDEDVTKQALITARDLLMAAIEDRPFDLTAALAALAEIKDDRFLGPSTASIVEAAVARRIPFIRLSDSSLVQLGYGAARRMIWTAETGRTSAIAEGISRDKDLTKSLLQSCGVPVPEGELVESADAAWQAAQSIGLPVVVKPEDGNHGRGVFTHLLHEHEVRDAYVQALAEGSGVLVERHIPGIEHRVLVVGGRVAAAARGEETAVIGDGVHTIEVLIERQINSDPRRGTTENHPLNRACIDSAARMELARLGLTEQSIPAVGERILISRHGNVAHDCTAAVHPSVAAQCVLAARIVGLDIAGIDLVMPDISQPLQAVGGAIIEVNAGPGLLMHLRPASGEPAPVGQAIVDHLFPLGDEGRIPLVGITGSHLQAETACLVHHLLQLTGRTVGLASSHGLFVKSRLIAGGDQANRLAANRLLVNAGMDMAVVENAARVILGEGLAYDRCAVGIVTDIDVPQHLGAFHIDSPEKVFSIFRTQIDVVLPDGVGVLNADEPMIAEMAPLCDGAVIFCSQQPESAVIAAHRAAGGRALVWSASGITAYQGDVVWGVFVPIETLPAPMAVMAAIAAAWALGLNAELIRAGLTTWVSGRVCNALA
ncbi:cyanophycin synthetase [Halothiobacillus sp. DCM-1]|uniref:cyanophycin synthetase n=1 Tax=Halothiobacillus sp. DCM-1 TaxID=3112558 RepID=UPI003243A60B